jgi:excinuclease ABC subunit A
MTSIHIKNARTHNLKNVTIDIPRDRFVVITGPSGSGKSSLALDTLFAEGRRQYIESLSAGARQYLHQMERPDVDAVEGLQPTVSIDQRSTTNSPRGTVATATEIYDYLRILYARLGTAQCYECGQAIRRQSPERILEEIFRLPIETKLMLLSPLWRGRRGQGKSAIDAARRGGFVRVRVDGVVFPIEDVPDIDPGKTHDIEAVVDRIVLREGVQSRVAESLKLVIKHGEGVVIVCHNAVPAESTSAWTDRLFSTTHSCPDCGINYAELEPRTFSFNSPYGLCTTCEGMGSLDQFDPDLVVPNRSKSPGKGAIVPWKGAASTSLRLYRELLTGFFDKHGFDWTTPLDEYPDEIYHEFLHGEPKPNEDVDDLASRIATPFPGVLDILEREFAGLKSKKTRDQFAASRGEVVCPDCKGARLRPEARSVLIAGRAIHEVVGLSVSAARKFFANDVSFPDEVEPIATPLLREISSRLTFLDQVGLEYLTLDRPTNTLSGGETQRVRLASGLGSGLVGVCYILDEPSIGLHPRDNDRLILAMRKLQEQGNTLLVVEHDEAVARQADWLIDMGPGAGRHGGIVVAAGTPEEVAENPESLTGKYLRGELSIPIPETRRRTVKSRSLVLEGASANNLKDVTVQIPLSAFVCVTGVSGSGKSSLLNETLAKELTRRLNGTGAKPGEHRGLRGANQIDKLIRIDQSPIGRSPRSSPATYTGVFDEIRKIFTQTKDAKRRGYKVGRFSFNVKGGRCETCQGRGRQKIQMNFLPDLEVLCPDCEGRRFNRATLDVRFKDCSIADVLDMRVNDAVEFFENFSAILRLLKSLQEVGLGYVTLGQASTTLSGGEAQRVKLAAELSRVETGKTLYLLDEPTTGLHSHDIQALLKVLSRLVDLGNTVVVIEHNIDVIKTADWVIDMGPEGGDRGGYITATGTPEEIAALDDNITGRFLRGAL